VEKQASIYSRTFSMMSVKITASKKGDGYVARCPEVKPLTKENRQRRPWSNYANRWNCTLATTSPRKSIVPKTKPFGFWPLFGLGLSLENGHLKIASPAGTPS